MKPFTYSQSAVRIVFGDGTLSELPAEIDRLGCSRALVLSTPGRQSLGERARTLLGTRAVGLFAGAVMHVPAEVADNAREEANRLGADCYVAVGGGSTTGLAKAIALKTGRPILSIPTTYAGSESTAIYGLTEGGAKRTGRDSRVLPRVVIYDPLLSSDLPLPISVTSGLNAIAHAVEALYARDVSPLIELMAQEGIHVLSHGLADLRAGRNKEEARSRCLYGSWLCGLALSSAGMALHHKLCHILGGSFNLPHAETHAVVLPYVVAYNAAAAPEAMARVAIALGADKAVEGIFDLVTKLEAPRSLKSIGLNEADIPMAVSLALKEPYYNPRAIDAQSIAKLLENAFLGKRPD